MNLNGYSTSDRSNRPSVDSRVALKIYFMNDGEYIDPVEIVDVVVFPRGANLDPSTLLNSDGLLNNSAVSSLAKAQFESSASEGWLDISNYTAGDQESASGVFRIKQGEYVVVLDGISDVSSFATRFNALVKNTASATGEYLDVWTIKYPTASDLKVVINQFNLYNDTFYTTTEPFMLKTSNELVTKKIPLGSKQDVKITTEFTIENRNIDSSLKNLFKTAIAINPRLKIEKLNDDPNLPSRVVVSAFEDTSGLIVTSSENTFIYNWDTEALKTHPQLLAGNLGNMRGIYAVTLQYDLLNERIVAPQMYIQLV